MVTRALVQYAVEHRGQLPSSLAELANDPNRRLRADALVCPAAPQSVSKSPTTQSAFAGVIDGGSVTYAYYGRGMAMRGPAKRILLHERFCYHDGARRVGFAYIDGQVDLLDAETAAKVIAELQAGHNPPRPEEVDGLRASRRSPSTSRLP